MQKFELTYASMISRIISCGEDRETRNGKTLSLFGEHLRIPINGKGLFPVLQGRKMYTKGIFGEFAAMVRKPKHIDDFRAWGCNYWDLWANADGSINIDYGNAWFDFNGVDQIAQLKDKLKNNPTDRRMIVAGWRPDKLDSLSLPCCHYNYQFYVRQGKYLDILWSQRSVDMMVGLPSDIAFAAAWLISLANEVGLVPGEITMSLGDIHVYEAHTEAAMAYIDYVARAGNTRPPEYTYLAPKGKDFCLFDPADLVVTQFHEPQKLHLELIA
jgi:thymidylate synthase